MRSQGSWLGAAGQAGTPLHDQHMPRAGSLPCLTPHPALAPCTPVCSTARRPGGSNRIMAAPGQWFASRKVQRTPSTTTGLFRGTSLGGEGSRWGLGLGRGEALFEGKQAQDGRKGAMCGGTRQGDPVEPLPLRAPNAPRLDPQLLHHQAGGGGRAVDRAPVEPAAEAGAGAGAGGGSAHADLVTLLRPF